MMEDHWDTRQEYIKQGNELAALERKQEQEKKEQEQALKEMQEKMSSVTYQTNNFSSSGGGDLNPVFVPQKQEDRSSSVEPNPFLGSPSNTVRPEQTPGALEGMRPLENRGRMGFQNNAQTSTFQRPFGQNNNGRF